MPLMWRNRLLWATSAIVFIIIQQPKTVSAQDGSDDTIFNLDSTRPTTYWSTTLSTDVTTQPPIAIDCPANVTWPVLKGQVGANVNWTEPIIAESSREDDGSDEITVVRPIRGPGSFFSIADNPVIQYLFLYKDAPPVVCEFPILFTIVEDTEGPEVVCPENVTEQVTFGQTFAFVSWSNPNATDNSGVVTLLEASHSQHSRFPVGTTNVTYTFVDPSGLANSCTFYVVIETLERDDTPPEITSCPDEDIMVKALSSEGGANVTWRTPEVSDDSGENATLTSDVPNPGSFFEFGVTTLLYNYRDPSYNFARCVFRILVVEVPDEENPCRISPCRLGDCALDFSEQGYRCSCDAGFHGDNCDLCLTGTVQDCRMRTLFANAAGRRTNAKLNIPLAQFDLVNVGVPLKPSINIEDGFPVGLTKFSFRAGCLKCVTSVIIEDKTPPEIEFCPDDITDFLEEGELIKQIEWPEPTVSDYQETSPPNTSSHLPGDFFGQGITRVTYNFTDDACNMAVCSFTIRLTTICPLSIRNCPVNGILARLPAGMDGVGVFWEDLDISNTSEFTVNSTHSPGDVFEIGETQVNYTAIDISGNIAECIFNVTVIEVADGIETAEFVNCSDPITVFATEGNAFVDNVSWDEPTFIQTDVSSQFAVRQTHFPRSRFLIGVTTVAYTAQNQQTKETVICSFTVTVIDEHAPVFTNCPSQRRVRACRGTVTAAWEPPSAIDNSQKDVDVDQIREAISGQTRFRRGSTLVTYIATDESSNLAVCAFFVEVHDEECSPIHRIVFSFVAGFFVLLIMTYLTVSAVFRCRRGRRRRRKERKTESTNTDVVDSNQLIEIEQSITNEDHSETVSETDAENVSLQSIELS